MSITQNVQFMLSPTKNTLYTYGEGNLNLTTYSVKIEQEQGPIFTTEHKYSIVVDSDGRATIQERF